MKQKIIHRDDVVKLLERLCQKLGSQKALAEKLGVSPSYISDVLSGRRDISESLARKLGLKVVIGYTPIKQEDER